MGMKAGLVLFSCNLYYSFLRLISIHLVFVKYRLVFYSFRQASIRSQSFITALSLSLSILTTSINADESIIATPELQPNIELRETSYEPGWRYEQADPVSPEKAREILGTNSTPSIFARAFSFFSTQATSNPPEVDALFVQLAEALENDPVRIYEFVRNNFEYVPYYGLLKGPYLTFHERSGNDFDQAAILVALLRGAGFEAKFRYGEISINTNDTDELDSISSWLGTGADPAIVLNMLAQGGIPAELENGQLRLEHIWVELALAGETVSLYPAYKSSKRYDSIDLESVTGFDQGVLLSAAGGTLSTNSIEDIDQIEIDNYLTALTTNLRAYLKLNHANQYIHQVIGGYEVVQDLRGDWPPLLDVAILPTGDPWVVIPDQYFHKLRIQHGNIDKEYDIHNIAGRKFSISYEGDDPNEEPVPEGYNDFGTIAPSNQSPYYNLTGFSFTVNTRSSITNTISGPDADFFTIASGQESQTFVGRSPSVSVSFSGRNSTGRKYAVLTRRFSAGFSVTMNLTGFVGNPRVAQIYIDDVLDVAEQSATESSNSLILSVDHPYASADGLFADHTSVYRLNRSGSYVLASAFGGDKNSTLLAERQRVLSNLRVQGYEPDSRELVSETLNVIGQTWMQQTQLNEDLLTAMSGVRTVQHHRFGIIGQESGYFIDARTQFSAYSQRKNTIEEGWFAANTFIQSAMEHGVLEQLQGTDNPGISTVRLFDIENNHGGKFFLLNSNNFDELVDELENYSASEIEQFQQLIDNGNDIIAPRNGLVPFNNWAGKAYVSYLRTDSAQRIGMIIGGGLNGGYSSYSDHVRAYSAYKESKLERIYKANEPAPAAADPVDLGSGAFLSELTDIDLGGGGPHGLAFSRSYNSQQVGDEDSTLGRGWTHNYNISLGIHSDIEAGLGEGTLFQALPAIVANYVSRELLSEEHPSVQHWMVAAFVSHWLVEQLLDKSVTVQIGSQALTYTEQPDGSFIPPANVTSDLVRLEDDTFELRERFGTVLKFDTNKKVQSLTDIDGNSLSFVYTGDQLASVTDTYGRSLALSYEGAKLRSVTDSTGRSVRYEYNGEQLTKVQGLEGAEWQYSYDDTHRMLTVVNPVGVTIVDNIYDSFDRVVQQTAPRQSGTAVYKMHYTGLSSSEEMPDGSRTTYFYDVKKRTIATENALGHKNRTEYNGQGHAIAYIDAAGNRSEIEYDKNQNVVAFHDPLAQTSRFEFDTQHRPIRAIDALEHVSETEFDDEHHPVLSRDALGHESVIHYKNDGLVDSIVDANGVPVQFSYDQFGQPTTSTTADYPAVTTEYDALGRMLSLTDRVGAKTSFTYDDRGLVLTTEDPLNQVSSAIYDALGRRISDTDRNGETTTATYTPTNNLASIRYPDKTVAEKSVPGFEVSYTYDEKDRVVAMVDPLGATTNEYDRIDRLIKHTDPNGHSIEYAYDALSNVTALTYPDGKTVSYQYDQLGRLSGISIDWLSKVAQPRYDAAGRLVSVAHFNGTSSRYTYDDADRLVELSHLQDSDEITGYQFMLDAIGNRIQSTLINPVLSLENELFLEQTKTFNEQKNRLLAAQMSNQTSTFTYDPEGQVTVAESEAETKQYVFDSAHRLVSYSSNDTTSSYSYDGAGNRLAATRNGVTTQYIYSASGDLVAEADETGKITRYYIYGLGLMAFVEATSGELFVYHHNATGHTVAVTDSTGTVVNRYAYSPFGQFAVKQELIAQPFTYAGQAGIYSEADNIYYMRARYYDANISRFISEDPAGFSGGLNLYAYAAGNPVTFIDPTGLSAEEGGIGKAVIDTLVEWAPGREWYLAVTNPNATQGELFEGTVLLVAQPVSKAFKVLKFARGLGNPFKNKTAKEIDRMFTKKGFTKNGPDPANGTGGYVNPKTGRSYHIDPKNRGNYREPNHVDVNRPRGYKGPLDKKKLPYKEE